MKGKRGKKSPTQNLKSGPHELLGRSQGPEEVPMMKIGEPIGLQERTSGNVEDLLNRGRKSSLSEVGRLKKIGKGGSDLEKDLEGRTEIRKLILWGNAPW